MWWGVGGVGMKVCEWEGVSMRVGGGRGGYEGV